MNHKIDIPPLWGVYMIDPEDGERAWISLPQIPGEPTVGFNREQDAVYFAAMSAAETGIECRVGRLNPGIDRN